MVSGHVPMSEAHLIHSKASTRSTKKNPNVLRPKSRYQAEADNSLRTMFLDGRWDNPAGVLALPLTSHESPCHVSEAPGAQEPTYTCWTLDTQLLNCQHVADSYFGKATQSGRMVCLFSWEGSIAR